VEELSSYLAAGVSFVGIAKVSGVPFDDEPLKELSGVTIDLPAQQLNKKDVRGLSIIRTLKYSEALTLPTSAIIAVSLPFRLSDNANIDRQLSVYEEGISKAFFNHSSSDSSIERNADKSFLKKVLKDYKSTSTLMPKFDLTTKSDAITDIAEKTANVAVSEDSAKSATTALTVFLRADENMKDGDIHAAVVEQFKRIIRQMRQLSTEVVPYGFLLFIPPPFVNSIARRLK
jgi:hypothetical protein